MEWTRKKIEQVKNIKIEKQEITEIVKVISELLSLFILTRSNVSKVSILEEVYFQIRFDILNEESKFDVKKGNLVLKIVLINFEDLFEFVLHFRIVSEFICESERAFIDAEFLAEIEAILDDLLK